MRANRRETHAYKLTGALRLPLHGDTIGVPLFEDGVSNSYFSVETDHFLRIRRFVTVVKELDRAERLDRPDDYAPFTKGDYSPIPVWIGGEKYILPGSSGREEIEIEIPPDKLNTRVVDRLVSICARARNREFVSSREPEDFLSSYRFLSHNFSGGRAWASKLGSVLRQACAYLHDDSIEWDLINRLISRWVDIYATRVSGPIFSEFVYNISRYPGGVYHPRLIIAAATLERLTTECFNAGPGTIAGHPDVGTPVELRELLLSSSAVDHFARRHHISVEAKLATAVERAFESGLHGHLVQLADLFNILGPLPVSNIAKANFPRVMRGIFTKMSTMNADRGTALKEDRSEHWLSLFSLATVLSQVVGDKEAEAKVTSSYQKYVQVTEAQRAD